MNPAALQGQHARRRRPAATLLVNVRRVRAAQPRQGRLRGEPARATARSRRSASYEVPMTSITIEATKELGVKPARRRALEELLRARADLLDVHASDRAARSSGSRSGSRTASRGARGQPRRVQGGLQLRRDRRAVRPPLRGRRRHAAAPGTYRNITGNVALSYGLVAAAQQAKLPIFYASYPITPASDILHELSKLKNFGVRTLQAEDEIAAARRRHRRRVRRPARRHRHQRPRRRPEVGGDRPRDQPRAAADHRRRAARRPVDRAADQDRAGRPAARDVRPPRRGAAADRRGAVAEPTASTPRSRRCASR